jgi:hypothetical protein
VLAVYLYTLSPEVTLEWSGVLASSAMYGSGASPPGYPLWSLYGWLFIKLLPFSNIAWRLSVSSAVAGASACGLIALIVSRGGAFLLEGSRALKRLESGEEKILRMVCGVVAAMAFGFQRVFWGEAVIVESTALGMALFCLVLFLLMRWSMTPKRLGFLYAAFLVFGLTLSVRTSWAAAALGLPFIVRFRRIDIGRDLFFAITTIFITYFLATLARQLPDELQAIAEYGSLNGIFSVSAIIAAAVTIHAIIKTRTLFSRWKVVLIAPILLLLGMSFYILIPIAAMTNPPLNWGYARTVEGFVHLISRGQYEAFHITSNMSNFASELWSFLVTSSKDLGILYLLAAIIPAFATLRMNSPSRAWILGLYATALNLSLATTAALNFGTHNDYYSWFLPPIHVVPAILCGYGLVLLGTVLAGRPFLARRLLNRLARTSRR